MILIIHHSVALKDETLFLSICLFLITSFRVWELLSRIGSSSGFGYGEVARRKKKSSSSPWFRSGDVFT